MKAFRFPLFLDLEGAPALVVGAGTVAARKIGHLLEAGARVTVVAPEASPIVARHAAAGALSWHARSYRRGDAADHRVVFAATDDRTVNALVAADARDAGALLCVADEPASGDFITPAVVRRGDLSVAISTNGTSPALARSLRGLLDELLADLGAQALARLRALRARRITARQAGPGRVLLVGAGPGDPDLLTVKARRALETADVIVYDALVSPEILALAAPGAEMVYAGKREGHHHLPQEEINALLVLHARRGVTVVRLKGGDPFVFGRGGEEGLALSAAGVPFEVVPGISAGIAAPAYAGIPVTHRQVAPAVTFVTGHECPASGPGLDWGRLAAVPGTLVVFMGLRGAARICEALIAGGRAAETPAAIISQGTTPRQRTVTGTLADIAERARVAELPAPALLVVGEVVALREALGWLAEAGPPPETLSAR